MESYKNLLETVPVFNITTAMKFLQFLFFGLNVFYGVVGTLFITMFFFVQWVSWPYSQFLGWDVINLSIIFIVIGVIMFIISVCGGIVSVKESTLLANVYAVVVLLLLVVELNAAVTLFIMYGNIRPNVEMNMHNTLKNRTLQDGWIMQNWNRMQQNLYCCGINHANDWAPLHVYGAIVGHQENMYNRYATRAPDNTYTVPFSCCESYHASENHSLSCENLKETGCLNALSWRLESASTIVAVTTGVMLTTQLLGCLIAYVLAKVIRRSKTIEEMKKQELQHLICKNVSQSQEEKEDTVNISEC